MSFELVVNAKPNDVVVALLQDGRLIEMHSESGSTDYNVGDIYLAKIKKVVPSLNAAFVNVGYEKDAFLHYLDLGPQFRSMDKYCKNTVSGKQNVPDLQYFKCEKDINKDGKIKEVLSTNHQTLVQVAKEPISTKGPRLTSEITLAGRYIILVPFSNKISVSQKIRDRSEKDRLSRLMSSIKPKNFGVIIRTVAKDKKVAQLDQDLRDLVEKWNKMHANIKKAKPPYRVLGELGRASSLLRDTLNEKFTSVHINDKNLMEEMKDYITSIAPGREDILKLYSGKKDIFERFSINKQIKMLFGRKVPLSNGGYLIIEHTEAMHVIDVNSGNRSLNKNQESNAVTTNLEAAKEIARVLRLRDMGGIVCVDFIDMPGKENNKKLYDAIKEQMKTDRAKNNVIPPSRFGVVEITRERVRPETAIKTSEVCPSCNGTGEIQASILFAEEIVNNLDYLINESEKKKIALEVHPYMAAYFKRGVLSHQWKWFLKYKKWISINENTSLPMMKYKFMNGDNKEITL